MLVRHSPVDHADVGAGLVVQPAELHGRDGLGRRLDGAAAPLGLHAGVGRLARGTWP